MKIGDLVRLSCYGQDRIRAQWIDVNDVGIIIRCVEHLHYPDEYVVKWVKSSYDVSRPWQHERYNTRKDLKYVKS